jgi:hypothetical protein
LTGNTRLNVLLIVCALVGSATVIAAAGIPADDGVIYGCYSKAAGQLRLVSPENTCRANEASIYWNQVGPAGPEGPAGPTGPQGPAGIGDVYSTDRGVGDPPAYLYADWSTIARFDLPAGRYAVAASTRLHNDTSIGRDAFCGVLVGTRSFDAADMVWGGTWASQAITGVSTLSEPGTVTLRCHGDPNEQATGFRAVTLQSYSFTVTTIGAAGQTATPTPTPTATPTGSPPPTFTPGP